MNPSFTKTVDEVRCTAQKYFLDVLLIAFQLDKSGITTIKITHAEMQEHKLVPANSDSYYIGLVASVTEKFSGNDFSGLYGGGIHQSLALSGTQKNVSSGVQAYKNIYRVQTQKQVDTFKPGLDYNITVRGWLKF